MIAKIGEFDIELDEVYMVGPCRGDIAYLRYAVTFKDGSSMFFYDNRPADENNFPREKFIKLWIASKSGKFEYKDKYLK